MVKNRLFQVNEEPISYGTYDVDTLTEFIDTVRHSNNKTTAIEFVEKNIMDIAVIS